MNGLINFRFRVNGLKFQIFPCENYSFILRANYDSLSLYMLKTLIHLARITEKVYTQKKRDVWCHMEPPCIYELIAQLKLCIQFSNHLLNLHSSGKELTVFQMNSLEVIVNFLKETVRVKLLERYNLLKNTLNDVYHVLSHCSNLEYPLMPTCIWCGGNTLYILNFFSFTTMYKSLYT